MKATVCLALLSLLVACENATRKKADSTPVAAEEAECASYEDHIETCKPYTCTFTHPFTQEPMTREIVGLAEGVCLYVEQMPNGGKMECRYPESWLPALAEFLRKSAAAESTRVTAHAEHDPIEMELDIDTSEDRADVKVTSPPGEWDVQSHTYIDGVEVEDPFQKALDEGVCVITGYGPM